MVKIIIAYILLTAFAIIAIWLILRIIARAQKNMERAEYAEALIYLEVIVNCALTEKQYAIYIIEMFNEIERHECKDPGKIKELRMIFNKRFAEVLSEL